MTDTHHPRPQGLAVADLAVADLAVGSFSDHAPWIVDPAMMPWRTQVPAARWARRRSLPGLLRARRSPPIRRVVTVLWHLSGAVVPWMLTRRRHTVEAGRADISRRLRQSAERLGPTYIKLAQIISSGEGLFPAELVDEFKRCRDAVPPVGFDRVRQTIEEDLGEPLEALFASFEASPVASASVAQVHRAMLRTGEPVVVKVRRPDIDLVVRRDLLVLAWLAPFLVGRLPVTALANPPALVELFAETICEELDFRIEAESMLQVAAAFAQLGQRGYVIPRPHPHLVTPRVLVMERLEGFAFDDVTGMHAAGVDTEAVIRAGMIGFIEGAMLHGVFHGDLHGGNLLVLPDGRIGLLDFGITARLDDPKRLAFLQLLVAASINDVRTQVGALRDLGALPPDVDIDRVIADLGLDRPPLDPTTLSPEELVAEVQQLVKALLGYGARMPKELMLFVKNLVFLDGAIASLAPDLDLIAEINYISNHLARRHGEVISGHIGVDPRDLDLDLSGVKASLGVDPDVDTNLTHRELVRRRQLIRERLSSRRAR